jgi:hypothetical protein
MKSRPATKVTEPGMGANALEQGANDDCSFLSGLRPIEQEQT